jgi:hypothetical protein
LSNLYYQADSLYYRTALAAVVGADARTDYQYYVSTDDSDAVAQHSFFAELPHLGVIAEDAPDVALWALSLCGRGIVTASSSFSWWAAFLRHDLRTPFTMPRSAFLLQEPAYPGGYFPAGAIVIDANGTILRH